MIPPARPTEKKAGGSGGRYALREFSEVGEAGWDLVADFRQILA